MLHYVSIHDLMYDCLVYTYALLESPDPNVEIE